MSYLVVSSEGVFRSCFPLSSLVFFVAPLPGYTALKCGQERLFFWADLSKISDFSEKRIIGSDEGIEKRQ